MKSPFGNVKANRGLPSRLAVPTDLIDTTSTDTVLSTLSELDHGTWVFA